MDNATGSGPRREFGRRRLRFGALALGLFLSIHCRVTASALTGGIFVFTVFMIFCVGMLGNPLRHFEVYLGQWSISGPGRAFRIIPMLDGIGIAICINAIIRAISYCCVASITLLYVFYSISDEKLPFTYCRDFDLNPYEPIIKSLRNRIEDTTLNTKQHKNIYTIGINDQRDWRNVSYYSGVSYHAKPSADQMLTCNELYTELYPSSHNTPAFNFFYVELVQLRPKEPWWKTNYKLLYSLMFVWAIIWCLILSERLSHGKMIWNNVYPWLMVVPSTWVLVILITAAAHIYSENGVKFNKIFRIGTKEMAFALADAMEIALYVHSASTGTELVHGKGLNHYASGHIDTSLHKENVMHSIFILLLATAHSAGATVCASLDFTSVKEFKYLYESTLWVLPMYSRCAVIGNYSHFVSVLIFSGLTFSYVTVAFILIKTALHTIFEYRVKLVFVEQYVVGGLMIVCISLSIIVTTNGGINILEAVDAVMCGLSMSFVCSLELIGMLCVYRCHDFLSDMMVATEDNTCGSRLGTQWQILPILVIACLLCKIISLSDAEFEENYVLLALIPFIGVLLAVPIRACHNAYVFLKPAPRRET